MKLGRALVLSCTLLFGQVGTSIVTAQDIDAGAEENVGSSSDALQGRPNQATAAGCGCSTVGARTESSPLVAASGILLIVAAASRRRARR